MNATRILCSVIFVAVLETSSQAVVNVQLNLRYNDPNDESVGGTWELLAGSDGGGIAGLTVLVENINNDAAQAGTAGFEVFETQQVGSVIEIVTGSDLEAPLDLDVGLGPGTTGNVVDDLFGPGRSPAIWVNNALLASGTFGEVRPSFLLTSGTLAAEVNEFDISEEAVAASFGALSVRGDSVATDGLRCGDADRDGDVDGDDFSLLAFSFGDAGAGWDQGNFNSRNGTNGDDFDCLAFCFGKPFLVPPPLMTIPEPHAMALAGITLVVCFSSRRIG